MIEPCLPAALYARAMVRAEFGRGEGSLADAVARHVMKRVHRRVGERLGPVGCDVLLARALEFAQRDRPWLAELRAGPGGALSGLDAASLDGNSVQEAAIAILCCFIEQLISLIGEDLALRLLRDVKPGAGEEGLNDHAV